MAKADLKDHLEKSSDLTSPAQDEVPSSEIVDRSFADDTPQTASSSTSKDVVTKDQTSDQKILSLLRQSILPFSDRLDPFAALPVRLDRLQEHLVSFYLLHYPKVTYGFSPRLRPHPVATNFSIALTTPACFQVILARSALYRLSLSKYVGEKQKKALEVVMMRHKGEALRLIRVLSAKSSPTRKDDLIASIISLGTLDRRTGSNDTAGMHFMAVRRILKATGGPLAVNSLLLSRVMVFFECIYGTSQESYIWDESDLNHLLPELNAFLAKIWALWKQRSAVAKFRGTSRSGRSQPYLQPGSDLHAILSRNPGPVESSEETPVLPQNRLEMMSQLTSLLTLAAIILDYENLPASARPSTFTAPSAARFSSSSSTLSSYLSGSVHTEVARKPPATSRSSTTMMASIYSNTEAGSKPRRRSIAPRNPSLRPLQPRPRTTSKPPTPPSFSHHDTTSTSDSYFPSTTPHTNVALHTYLTTLHNQIASLSLLTQPTNNVMWTIQMQDHSTPHNVRVWKVAGFVWLLKRVNWQVQREIAGWVSRFLGGEGVFEGSDDEGGEYGGTGREGVKEETTGGSGVGSAVGRREERQRQRQRQRRSDTAGAGAGASEPESESERETETETETETEADAMQGIEETTKPHIPTAPTAPPVTSSSTSARASTASSATLPIPQPHTDPGIKETRPAHQHISTATTTSNLTDTVTGTTTDNLTRPITANSTGNGNGNGMKEKKLKLNAFHFSYAT